MTARMPIVATNITAIMIAALYSFFNLNPLYFLIMIEFNSNIVIEIYICIVLEIFFT